MRKRLLLLAFWLAVALCGCEATDKEIYAIAPADFSEETRQVLDALDADIAFYDYRLDDSVKSFSVDIWRCADGVWTCPGSIRGNIDDARTGRIGLCYTPESCSVITLDANGHTRYDSPDGVDFSSVSSTGRMQLNETKGWTLNEEAVLLVETGTNASEYKTFSMEEFRETDCEVGVAFTLLFSDQPLS